MQNVSFENEFDLHENDLAGETHFHKNGFALRLVLDMKANQNSEMGYSESAVKYFVEPHLCNESCFPKTIVMF